MHAIQNSRLVFNPKKAINTKRVATAVHEPPEKLTRKQKC